MLIPSLPYDILEHIANYADIDTRRYMGFKPRKLNKAIIDKMDELIAKRQSLQNHNVDKEVWVFMASRKNPGKFMAIIYNFVSLITEVFNVHGRIVLLPAIFGQPCALVENIDKWAIYMFYDYKNTTVIRKSAFICFCAFLTETNYNYLKKELYNT